MLNDGESPENLIDSINRNHPGVQAVKDLDLVIDVIQNIVGNALKYTERGGCITVMAEKRLAALHFAIEDTGCGIKPEDVPFVFEPFFRGDKSRDPNISGSGLGLSIAKYIVEQHDGQIACESTLGEGTRITLSLSVM
ncbi:MAG: ATP-binding protein [Peptococcaceae bacterium]|nr:ATP-binding protein [Peptococcaceae bacterium]